MPSSHQLAQKVVSLEEHQMFLERQIDEISSEVMELSRLLHLARADLKKLEAALSPRPQDDQSSQQA